MANKLLISRHDEYMFIRVVESISGIVIHSWAITQTLLKKIQIFLLFEMKLLSAVLIS